MPTFAERLADARTLALSRLLDIAEHSADEKEARLAAAAILKVPPPPDAPASPPAAKAPAPAPAAPTPPIPKPWSPAPTSREVNRLVAALSRTLIAGAPPAAPARSKSPYTAPP